MDSLDNSISVYVVNKLNERVNKADINSFLHEHHQFNIISVAGWAESLNRDFYFYLSSFIQDLVIFQTSMETAPVELCVSCTVDLFKASGLWHELTRVRKQT